MGIVLQLDAWALLLKFRRQPKWQWQMAQLPTPGVKATRRIRNSLGLSFSFV